MKSPTRTLRRTGAALAVAGAAVLGVTAASAATNSPAGARPAPPACTASKLTVWLGVPGNGAAGTIYYELQFSNTSRSTCTLRGYPKVWAQRGGSTIGSVSSHIGGRARTVTLRPGGTAHALLGVLSAGCPTAPVNADGLKVHAPGVKKAAFVDYSFSTCTSKGGLRVGVVKRGAGIPGYSQ